MEPQSDIDILESTLRRTGKLLDILLIDRTTKKNIIWATDSYTSTHGSAFAPKEQIKPELVTGIYNKLIQPRAIKSLVEQRQRTKDKGEVFTPLKIVEQMNNEIDQLLPSQNNWQEYIKELKLEITCGEAPFIVTRYNPTSHTKKLIKLENRVGFLDRKLQVISKHCDKKEDWLKRALIAYKSCYGYEWQGDNVLLARENLLYTLFDYYQDKFGGRPPLSVKEEFATVISWNIFQMDGLKYVVPMSCYQQVKKIPEQISFIDQKTSEIELFECEGCKQNNPYIHNGTYVKIMDWETNKKISFVDLIKQL